MHSSLDAADNYAYSYLSDANELQTQKGQMMTLEQAIELSRSTNQIVDVALDYTDDITTVTVDAGEYADNVDCVRENDGTFDLWGWSDEMAAAGSTDMEWRLKVTLGEPTMELAE